MYRCGPFDGAEIAVDQNSRASVPCKVEGFKRRECGCLAVLAPGDSDGDRRSSGDQRTDFRGDCDRHHDGNSMTGGRSLSEASSPVTAPAACLQLPAFFDVFCEDGVLAWS